MADTRKQDKPFGSPAGFEMALPGLEDAVIEYRVALLGGAFRGNRPLPTTRLSLGEREPIMHWLNPNCRHGGYDVSNLIREMLSDREVEREGRVSCAGKEAEPGKSWEECDNCSWAWDFRIALVPK